MSVKHQPHNRWLLLSLAVNLLLLLACLVFLFFARQYYAEYRYYRAQAHGSSEATTLEVDADTQQQVLVLLGDSRVMQWDPLPALDNTVVINAGVAGETTSEIRRRLQQDVLRHAPDIVLVQAGVNDLTMAVTRGIRQPDEHLATLQSNIKYLVQTLLSHGVQVILTPVLPNKPLNPVRRLFWHNQLHTLLAETNTFLEETATADDAVAWLDLTPVLYDSDGTLRTGRYVDTLHFNSTAYKLFNDAVIKLLTNNGQ